MLPKRLRPPITVEDGKVHAGIALGMAALTILFSGALVLTAVAQYENVYVIPAQPPSGPENVFSTEAPPPQAATTTSQDFGPRAAITAIEPPPSACPSEDTRRLQIESMVKALYEQCLAWGQQCNQPRTYAPTDCEAGCNRLSANDAALRIRCLETVCGQSAAAGLLPTRASTPTQDCNTICLNKQTLTVTSAFSLNDCLLECSGRAKPPTYSREICLAQCEEEARACSLGGVNSALLIQTCNNKYRACAAGC